MQVFDDILFNWTIPALDLAKSPLEVLVIKTAILVVLKIWVLKSALTLISATTCPMAFGGPVQNFFVSMMLSAWIISTWLLYLVHFADYGRKIYWSLEMRVDKETAEE